MIHLPRNLKKIHRLVLRAYPSEYLETFGNEMHTTFIDGLDDAITKNMLAWFILREIRDMPKSLAGAYWYGWSKRILSGIELLQDAASSSDLPPAPPDGRDSWRQALLELSMFLIAGSLLVPATYFPFAGLQPGWTRDIGFLGKIIVPFTLPFLLFGLGRGLPRWTYPFGGLLIAYFGVSAGQTSLWLFLPIMLLAASILAMSAILMDPNPSRLPVPVRRIVQSLSLDWTRLSFGIFGAMPLIILMAFDDAHTNSRTPYLAFSVAVMVVSAFVYCRSRNLTAQIASLLAGMTFSIWGGWWDKVSLLGDLANWSVVAGPGSEGLTWMLTLWLVWALIMMSPVLLILINKMAHLQRVV